MSIVEGLVQFNSVADWAHVAGGPEVSERLKRSMAPSAAWKKQQVRRQKTLGVPKHALIQEEGFKNRRQRDWYRAAASVRAWVRTPQLSLLCI